MGGFFRYVSRTTYRYILKPIFFRFDPEKIHDFAISCGRFFAFLRFPMRMMSFFYIHRSNMLSQKIHGLEFENPFCVAGGFDKEGYLTEVFPALGFGFMEIGSITLHPYVGNPRPRVMRLPKSRALWVNYGLKNQGAEAIFSRLEGRKFPVPMFVNVAKTNCVETADTTVAVEDYALCVRKFHNLASAFTINISCPNAYGGQPFHNSGDLRKLLERLKLEDIRCPVFLKISPDLSEHNVDEILSVAGEYRVDGFIISNLRKDGVLDEIDPSERALIPAHGGISGQYVRTKSDTMLAYIAKKIQRGECKKFVLIGLGGVMNAQDAYVKIRSGASLVQLVTGLIFEGPQIAGDLSAGLEALLKRDGFTHISQAIGKDIHA